MGVMEGGKATYTCVEMSGSFAFGRAWGGYSGASQDGEDGEEMHLDVVA